MSLFPNWNEERTYAHIVSSVIFLLAIFLAASSFLAIKKMSYVGRADVYEHSISVEGVGKATAKPDVAVISFGVETKDLSVAIAQRLNTETMNLLLEKMKSLEISSDDIQTQNYNVYENVEWNQVLQKTQTKGWVVSQSVKIKVRNLEKIPTVLTIVGENGATNVSGPSFTVDDDTVMKSEARSKAVDDARKKAEELATKMGVKLDGVIGFSEWSNQPYPMLAELAMSSDMGSGGGPAPTLESGLNEVQVSVSVTYKLAD